MQAQLQAQQMAWLDPCGTEGAECKVRLEVEFKAQPEAEHKERLAQFALNLLLPAGRLLWAGTKLQVCSLGTASPPTPTVITAEGLATVDRTSGHWL